jgi:hypothetical protein
MHYPSLKMSVRAREKQEIMTSGQSNKNLLDYIEHLVILLDVIPILNLQKNWKIND